MISKLCENSLLSAAIILILVTSIVILIVYVRRYKKRYRLIRSALRAFRANRGPNTYGEVILDREGCKIIIDPNDAMVSDFIKKDGVWEAHVGSFLKKVVKAGAHVVVVGGHIGYHVVHLSKLVGDNGSILCFEANPRTYNYLVDNVKINDCSNVRCRQKAIYSRVTTLKFAALNKGDCNTGGSHVIAGEPTGRSDQIIIEVEASTLDIECADMSKIDFLMMDIEGSEVAAVEGGMKVLDRFPNLVVIQEWSKSMMTSHGDLGAYIKIWRSRGYSIAKINGDSIDLMSDEDLVVDDIMCDVVIARDLASIEKLYPNSGK